MFPHDPLITAYCGNGYARARQRHIQKQSTARARLTIHQPNLGAG
jgi:hypothetical protein